MDLEGRIDLFRNSLGFEDVGDEAILNIATLSFVKRFRKGETVFDENDACHYFHVVAEGLVKVSLISFSGNRMTYLLAGYGEPLNLVGPFSGTPRPLCAEAIEESTVAHMKKKDFVAFAHKNPVLMNNIIVILGHAVDSANSRVLDMMEMRVEKRLLKVLFTLYLKFGERLDFTSAELAELAGTTTESALRVMSRLRRSGIIQTQRGRIHVQKPEHLESVGTETMWI